MRGDPVCSMTIDVSVEMFEKLEALRKASKRTKASIVREGIEMVLAVHEKAA